MQRPTLEGSGERKIREEEAENVEPHQRGKMTLGAEKHCASRLNSATDVWYC